MKNLFFLLLAMTLSFAGYAQAPAPISGPDSTCYATPTTYTDATPGGTWSTSDASLATIDMATGVLYGFAGGYVTVTYTLPSTTYATFPVVLKVGPLALSGPSFVCVGSSIVLTDPAAGGAWSSADPAVATMDISGDVFGVSAGSVTISYTQGLFGCTVTQLMTVGAAAPAISGVTSICVGSTTVLTDAGGGTWSSSNVAVASVGSVTGIVTGVTPGPAIITYSLGTSCNAAATVNVFTVPCSPGGPSSVCAGASITLTDCATGGTWSSSATGVATIDPATGVLTGIAPGSVTITYSLGGSCSVTTAITVIPGPTAITGSTSVCVGSSTTFADATPGGTWSAGSTGDFTISSAGVATGDAVGADFVYYTISTGCFATAILSVNPLPAAYTVTGGGSYCSGGTGVHIILDGSDAGVTYQLYNGATPIGSAITGTGAPIDFGLETAAGTYTVAASGTGGCVDAMVGSVTITIGAAPVMYSITPVGGGAYCAGGPGVHIGLDNSDVGVDYQLWDGTTPEGGPMPGTGAAIDFGLVTTAGSYTIIATNATSGCTSTMTGIVVVSISPLPTAYTVTGGGSYCTGGTGANVGLSGSNTGIDYQLMFGTTIVGTPVAGTGSAIDFGPQTAAGLYTVVATNSTTTCARTMSGSVTVTIASVILPTVTLSESTGTTVCTGTTVTFTATPTGGGSAPTYAWTVNGSAVSSAATTYSYTPADGDIVAVTMTSSATCASVSSVSDNVTMHLSIPTITAFASSAACDGSYTLTAGGGVTYSWAPATGLSCASCASTDVNPTASASFTVTGADALGCTGTASVSVDGNRISGTVSPAVSGTIRVWLVQFDPSDSSITALDSMTTCTSGSTQYYDFPDPATGNYMVKAYLLGSTPGTSGYIPTYSSSAAHWDAAASVSHASATDHLNVTMIYGTVPAGPGFIGGYIGSGAGKGTSSTAPVSGMLVFLKDESGNILTYTYTDASGNYGFNLLANGSYMVSPEAFQYTTIPSATLILTSSTETIDGVNFKQHTSSKTITPFDYTIVKPVVVNTGITVYPNPASGDLNIQWQNQSTGVADVVITDVVGREVYKSAINIGTASGQSQVSLSGVKDGVYVITIKSEGIYYSGKLVVQQ